jgi:hypothetical protein
VPNEKKGKPHDSMEWKDYLTTQDERNPIRPPKEEQTPPAPADASKPEKKK